MVSVTTKAEAALWYARNGIAVFPLYEMDQDGQCACRGKVESCEPGKHPRVSGAYLAGTTDLNAVQMWWQAWPNANIGAAMKQSLLLCIDIDPDAGGEDNWLRICQELELPRWPNTWTNLTGGGGQHFYWRVPPDFDCVQRKLARGVDVRWKGYAILPPSDHKTGALYQWQLGDGPEDYSEPPILPLALMDRLLYGTADEQKDNKAAATDVAALLMQDCPEGGRHDTMHSILSWMRDIMPRERAQVLALSWNETHCHPPLPEAEVIKHVEWVYTHYKEPAQAILDVIPNTPVDSQDVVDGYVLHDAVDYKNRPRPRWQVEELIQEKTYSVIYGPPGTYKTFLTLDMALSLAFLPRWQRRRVKRGKVLYVLAEGQGGFPMRLEAWERGHGVEIPRNVLRIIDQPVPLTDADAVRKFVAAIEAQEDFQPSLIIFDTLSANLPGINENDSAPFSTVNAIATRLILRYGCSVILLHHGRKSDGGLRGHGALFGNLNTVLQLSLVDETHVGYGQKVIRVLVEKQKDGGEQGHVAMYLRPVTVDVPASPDDDLPEGDDDIVVPALTSSVMLERLSDAEEQTLRQMEGQKKEKRPKLDRGTWGWKFAEVLVLAFGRNGATHEAWRKAAVARAVFDPEGQRKAFLDAKAKLVEEGWITTRERHDGETTYLITDQLVRHLNLNVKGTIGTGETGD